jgi:large subunit ribosomal protein L9
MQVILLKDVKKVGQRGSVVSVADGYGMNVLIRGKLALPATPENLKQVEKVALAAQGKRDMDAALAKKALEAIDGKEVRIAVKANDSGVLFEAIKAKQVNEALGKTYGVSLPESALGITEPIKKAGTYSVSVALHGARAAITVVLVGS